MALNRVNRGLYFALALAEMCLPEGVEFVRDIGLDVYGTNGPIYPIYGCCSGELTAKYALYLSRRLENKQVLWSVELDDVLPMNQFIEAVKANAGVLASFQGLQEFYAAGGKDLDDHSLV